MLPEVQQLQNARSGRWQTEVIAAALLVGSVWFVYGRAFDAPFVCDDSVSIAENESIRLLWPLWGNAERPGPLNPPQDLPTCGRPLVNLSFALNYCFGELDPRGYRVVNIALHTLNVLLLAALVWRTLRLPYFGGRFDGAAGSLAFGVALVWAVHPLVTEAVVYVTQRTELMASFFCLATLYASLRYWETVGARWGVAAVFACWAGMASKEIMATAPVMVLLFDRTFISGSLRAAWQKSRPLYVGLFASWLLAVCLAGPGPHTASAGFHLGVSATDWWYTQSKLLFMYLQLAVWPWPLSIHYDPPYLTSFREAWIYVVPVALLVVVTLVLLWRRSAVGYLGACALAILAPTLVVPIVTEIAAERRMYLPLAAIVTLVVAGGYVALRHVLAAKPALATVAAAALLLACVGGAVSSARLVVYRDELTLWQDVVSHDPANAKAQYNVGTIFLERQEPQRAIAYFERAIKLRPQYAPAHHNLGAALSALGRDEESIREFESAVEVEPGYALGHVKLAILAMNAGRVDGTIRHARAALHFAPDDAEAHNLLGAALAQQGQLPEAVEHFEAAVRLDPNMLQAQGNLMAAYASLGRSEEALATAEKALALARASGDTSLEEQITTFLKHFQTQSAESPLTPSPSPSE